MFKDLQWSTSWMKEVLGQVTCSDETQRTPKKDINIVLKINRKPIFVNRK